MGLRIGVFDIETWDLSAQYGPILCASVLKLEPGEAAEMISFRQDHFLKKRKAEDMTDDRELVVALRDHLESFHMTVGWYTKGFDIPHVNTRLALHSERLLQRNLHLDPIWFFRGWRGLKPMSSKMKHVAAFFGMEQKVEVEPEVWLKARGGNSKAMDLVVERCESDVRITAELLEKALDLGLVKNIQSYP